MTQQAASTKVQSKREQQLEFQADQIETVLAQHGIKARVTGGLIRLRWIQFWISSGSVEQIGKITDLSRELALALYSDTCRISHQRGLLAVEIPRPDPQPVRLLPLQHKLMQRDKLSPATVILGLSDEDAPLLARLPSPQVGHLLITGDAGSGKSTLLRSIVASLALHHRRSQLCFVLIDPRRRTFGPLAGLPHLLRPVLSRPDDIDQTLRTLAYWTTDRCNDGHPRTPRIVVALDELNDVLALPDVGGEAGRALAHLAAFGREAGIHLVACAPKITEEAVQNVIGDHFPVRLVGRLPAERGAEQRMPGDFVSVVGEQAVGFQAAYVSAQELAAIACQTSRHARELHSASKTRSMCVVPRPQPARNQLNLWELIRHWLREWVTVRQGYRRTLLLPAPTPGYGGD